MGIENLRNKFRPPDAPGFDGSSERVDISSSEEKIGVAQKRAFEDKFQRPLPWWIGKDGILVVINPRPMPTSMIREFPDGVIKIKERIDTNRIENEQISEELAEAIATFKRVEDSLPDYSKEAARVFRPYWGLSRALGQWTHEEGQHSDALGTILVKTGKSTQEELDRDYYDHIKQTWELPFKTARQVAIYARFQELMTSLAYLVLAKQAMSEGASAVSGVMTTVARDEAWHGASYQGYVEEFLKEDFDGTKADILYVASYFRMPAQAILRRPNEELKNLVKLGAFSLRMVTESGIARVLKSFGIFTDQEIRDATRVCLLNLSDLGRRG